MALCRQRRRRQNRWRAGLGKCLSSGIARSSIIMEIRLTAFQWHTRAMVAVQRATSAERRFVAWSRADTIAVLTDGGSRTAGARDGRHRVADGESLAGWPAPAARRLPGEHVRRGGVTRPAGSEQVLGSSNDVLKCLTSEPLTGPTSTNADPPRPMMVPLRLERVPNTLRQVAFDDPFSERPMELVHDLHLDDQRRPLHQLADLADRLPRESVIYDKAVQPLLVPSGGPPRGALEQPGDVIRDLHNADAWLTLIDVQADPGMAELMNTHLDGLESGMIAKQGALRKRVALVFVSSPNSVTPVHFDIEHSLLMQVSGTKTVSIGCFESDAVRRHEIDRYWNGSHGRIEIMPRQVASYTLTPGRGVYIPTAHLTGCITVPTLRCP